MRLDYPVYAAVKKIAGKKYQEGSTAAYQPAIKSIVEKMSAFGDAKGNNAVPGKIGKDMP
jgi:hypothetical protein